MTFLPDAAGHNVGSIDGMSPAGTEPWDSSIEEQLTVTFSGRVFMATNARLTWKWEWSGSSRSAKLSQVSILPWRSRVSPERAETYMKVLLGKAGVVVED